jgi:short-subunit dehydrogenase
MKRAIVMGASSGMGREVAQALAAEGWQVGIAARRLEPLQELQRVYPNRVEVREIDICNEQADNELLRLIEQIGGVDLYFHASGIGKQNPDLSLGIEMRTVETNVVGFTRLIDTVFNYMASHGGGQIAVISSIAGTRGLSPAPSYSATKAFQNNYLEALEQASVTRGLNIRVTDIRPGFVDTPLLAGGHYPMTMPKEKVVRAILRAVRHRRHVCVIDGRYRWMVFFWRLVPRCLWRRIRLMK